MDVADAETALCAQAKESGSVLLFDEAEGIFAERRDSSEKHDLEEANLLLQLVGVHIHPKSIIMSAMTVLF